MLSRAYSFFVKLKSAGRAEIALREHPILCRSTPNLCPPYWEPYCPAPVAVLSARS